MAGGTDQSVNLSGMLNQIAGTIGSGYTIAGKSAGEAMGDGIANAFRPKVDPEDADSLLKYAQWAKNNGKTEEARMYEEKARILKGEKREANAIASAAAFGEKANLMIANGDVEGFNGMLSSANKDVQAAANSGDLATARALSAQSQQLQGQRGVLQDNRIKSQANQVLNLTKALDNGYVTDAQGNRTELTPKTRQDMEQGRTTLLGDHEVTSRVNQMALQQHQVSVAQKAQEREAIEAKVMPAISQASTQEELETAIASVPPEVYQDLLPVINAQEQRLERKAERDERAVTLQTAVFGDTMMPESKS